MVERSSSETATLKPCPFCGTDASMANTGTCWVRCNNCECCAEGPTADTEQEAIEKWNGHFIIKCVNSHEALKARIEELTDALRALELQALQSDINDPANEWGMEALSMARAALNPTGAQ